MVRRMGLWALTFALALVGATAALAAGDQPQTVIVRSSGAALRALVFRPAGPGPFPALLLVHGSGRTPEQLRQLGPYETQAYGLGGAFARRGYVLMYLFRRGVGPSTDQGASAIDLMEAGALHGGPAARERIQLELLQGRELEDERAALKVLRALPGVDPRDVGLVGHSFGGSLTVLLAAREPRLRAVVVFAGAGYSWDKSSALRARLLRDVGRIRAPTFFIHAANDYSTTPGAALDARRAALGLPHRVKIYPAFGQSRDDGHNFLYLAVDEWSPDVFGFLDASMRTPRR